ncbi:mucin-19 [Nilaparvata lugens]|uniref:mucin-19 n=1 Tax=Nilaparvata lugens TaxID=108931 RepID=UPI00193E71B9|nr:mucin-19 [Nilaparvata lugens]
MDVSFNNVLESTRQYFQGLPANSPPPAQPPPPPQPPPPQAQAPPPTEQPVTSPPLSYWPPKATTAGNSETAAAQMQQQHHHQIQPQPQQSHYPATGGSKAATHRTPPLYNGAASTAPTPTNQRHNLPPIAALTSASYATSRATALARLPSISQITPHKSQPKSQLHHNFRTSTDYLYSANPQYSTTQVSKYPSTGGSANCSNSAMPGSASYSNSATPGSANCSNSTMPGSASYSNSATPSPASFSANPSTASYSNTTPSNPNYSISSTPGAANYSNSATPSTGSYSNSTQSNPNYSISTPGAANYSNSATPSTGSYSNSTQSNPNYSISTPGAANYSNSATPITGSYSKSTPSNPNYSISSTPGATNYSNSATPSTASYSKSTPSNPNYSISSTPGATNYSNSATPITGSYSKSTPSNPNYSISSTPGAANYSNSVTPSTASYSKSTPSNPNYSISSTPGATNYSNSATPSTASYSKCTPSNPNYSISTPGAAANYSNPVTPSTASYSKSTPSNPNYSISSMPGAANYSNSAKSSNTLNFSMSTSGAAHYSNSANPSTASYSNSTPSNPNYSISPMPSSTSYSNSAKPSSNPNYSISPMPSSTSYSNSAKPSTPSYSITTMPSSTSYSISSTPSAVSYSMSSATVSTAVTTSSAVPTAAHLSKSPYPAATTHSSTYSSASSPATYPMPRATVATSASSSPLPVSAHSGHSSTSYSASQQQSVYPPHSTSSSSSYPTAARYQTPPQQQQYNQQHAAMQHQQQIQQHYLYQQQQQRQQEMSSQHYRSQQMAKAGAGRHYMTSPQQQMTQQHQGYYSSPGNPVRSSQQPQQPATPVTTTANNSSQQQTMTSHSQSRVTGLMKRESPLDLSVKTVRQSADSSTAKDESENYHNMSGFHHHEMLQHSRASKTPPKASTGRVPGAYGGYGNQEQQGDTTGAPKVDFLPNFSAPHQNNYQGGNPAAAYTPEPKKRSRKSSSVTQPITTGQYPYQNAITAANLKKALPSNMYDYHKQPTPYYPTAATQSTKTPANRNGANMYAGLSADAAYLLDVKQFQHQSRMDYLSQSGQPASDTGYKRPSSTDLNSPRQAKVPKFQPVSDQWKQKFDEQIDQRFKSYASSKLMSEQQQQQMNGGKDGSSNSSSNGSVQQQNYASMYAQQQARYQSSTTSSSQTQIVAPVSSSPSVVAANHMKQHPMYTQPQARSVVSEGSGGNTYPLYSTKVHDGGRGKSGANKQVLSILRNSLEIKEARNLQMQQQQEQQHYQQQVLQHRGKSYHPLEPMMRPPGAAMPGAPPPPRVPPPTARHNLPPFGAIAVERSSTATPPPYPGYKFHLPKAVDSVQLDADEAARMQRSAEAVPPPVSAAPGADSPTATEMDGLAAFLAARIRTKAELKQVGPGLAGATAGSNGSVHSPRATPGIFSPIPAPVRTPDIAKGGPSEGDLGSASSVSTTATASPPKLTRERGAHPLISPRRLFKSDDESMPAAMGSSSSSQSQTAVAGVSKQPLAIQSRDTPLRSSSEASVFDFRESDSESEMPVLERQSLNEMRSGGAHRTKQRRQRATDNAAAGGKTSSAAAAAAGQSTSQIVEMPEEAADSFWSATCDDFLTQLQTGKSLLKRRGRRKKKRIKSPLPSHTPSATITAPPPPPPPPPTPTKTELQREEEKEAPSKQEEEKLPIRKEEEKVAIRKEEEKVVIKKEEEKIVIRKEEEKIVIRKEEEKVAIKKEDEKVPVVVVKVEKEVKEEEEKKKPKIMEVVNKKKEEVKRRKDFICDKILEVKAVKLELGDSSDEDVPLSRRKKVGKTVVKEEPPPVESEVEEQEDEEEPCSEGEESTKTRRRLRERKTPLNRSVSEEKKKGKEEKQAKKQTRSLSPPKRHKEKPKKFGDGCKFTPGWEEDLLKYKKSLRMPARLITISRPANWPRATASLPDLDSPRAPDSPLTCDSDTFTPTKKEQVVVKDDKSTPSKDENSFLNRLVQRYGGKGKKSIRKAVLDDKKPKKIEKSSDGPELLPTPRLDELVSKKDEPLTVVTPAKKPRGRKPKKEKEVKDKEEMEVQCDSNDNNAVYLGYFRKKTVAEFREAFERHNGAFVAENDLPPVVYESRTRTQTRVLKQQATIREVFGDDRPASAPPAGCRGDGDEEQEVADVAKKPGRRKGLHQGAGAVSKLVLRKRGNSQSGNRPGLRSAAQLRSSKAVLNSKRQLLHGDKQRKRNLHLLKAFGKKQDQNDVSATGKKQQKFDTGKKKERDSDLLATGKKQKQVDTDQETGKKIDGHNDTEQLGKKIQKCDTDEVFATGKKQKQQKCDETGKKQQKLDTDEVSVTGKKQQKLDTDEVFATGKKQQKRDTDEVLATGKKQQKSVTDHTKTSEFVAPDDSILPPPPPLPAANEASTLGEVQPSKKLKLRRKLKSSGFDYIRKKKKQQQRRGGDGGGGGGEMEPPKEKRKSAFSVLKSGLESEQDIQNEIKGWVINKGLGETVLHRAARLGYTDVVAYCLEKLGNNPSPRDNAGYTPLYEACSRNHIEIARLLLLHGANPSDSAQGGIRLLHEASENGFCEVMRLLLSYGADPLLATYAGHTPLSLASTESAHALLLHHLADVQGMPAPPWHFNGLASVCDVEKSGNDPVADAPDPEEVTDIEELVVDYSEEAPLPNLYTLNDEEPSDRWVLFQEICATLRVKTRDALLRQLGPTHKNDFRDLKLSEFYDQARCCMLMGAGDQLINPRAHKVVLVKYTEQLRALLHIHTDSIPIS